MKLTTTPAPAPRPAFITQLLLWSLVLVLISGASGVAVIWQRQLIVQTANRIKTLETALAEVERRQTELNTEIAAARSLDALQTRNTAFALNLAPIREQQLIRVTADPEQRLRNKRPPETYALATPPRDARPSR